MPIVFTEHTATDAANEGIRAQHRTRLICSLHILRSKMPKVDGNSTAIQPGENCVPRLTDMLFLCGAHMGCFALSAPGSSEAYSPRLRQTPKTGQTTPWRNELVCIEVLLWIACTFCLRQLSGGLVRQGRHKVVHERIAVTKGPSF